MRIGTLLLIIWLIIGAPPRHRMIAGRVKETRW